MKRSMNLLAAVLVSFAAVGQNNDYLLKKDFQAEKQNLVFGIDAARRAVAEAKKTTLRQARVIDSLNQVIAAQEKRLGGMNDSLTSTASRFGELQTRVDKKTTTSQQSFLYGVLVIGALLLGLLGLIYYFRSRSARHLEELKEENKKLGDGLRLEMGQVREENLKAVGKVSQELREQGENISSKIALSENSQRQVAMELEELVSKAAKEQNLKTSTLETGINELRSALIDKKEHGSVHEKMETELKNLRTLVKEFEEFRKGKH